MTDQTTHGSADAGRGEIEASGSISLSEYAAATAAIASRGSSLNEAEAELQQLADRLTPADRRSLRLPQ
jgi:hypothetical protein